MSLCSQGGSENAIQVGVQVSRGFLGVEGLLIFDPLFRSLVPVTCPCS